MICQCEVYGAGDAYTERNKPGGEAKIGVPELQAFGLVALSLFPGGHADDRVGGTRRDTVVFLQIAGRWQRSAEYFRDLDHL